MMICKVVGHVWATKKEESLNGFKLMIVRKYRSTYLSKEDMEDFVAVDVVGAGIGETVLVVNGSTARKAFAKGDDMPADAAIVGIVDSVEKVQG